MNGCSTCHGPDGDQVPGIDLGHGKFVHASTDEQLVEIIIDGISGAGMPANKMTESQAYSIVAYLHFLAESSSRNTSTGDAARGKAVFEGPGGCRNCHRVMGQGSRLGPDLSEIGVRSISKLPFSIPTLRWSPPTASCAWSPILATPSPDGC
jgi:mono/diheme cytochrome c family protein